MTDYKQRVRELRELIEFSERKWRTYSYDEGRLLKELFDNYEDWVNKNDKDPNSR